MKKLITTKFGTMAIVTAAAMTLSLATTIIPMTAQSAEAWAPSPNMGDITKAPKTSEMAWSFCPEVKDEKKGRFQDFTVGKSADRATPDITLDSCDNVDIKVSP